MDTALITRVCWSKRSTARRAVLLASALLEPAGDMIASGAIRAEQWITGTTISPLTNQPAPVDDRAVEAELDEALAVIDWHLPGATRDRATGVAMLLCVALDNDLGQFLTLD